MHIFTNPPPRRKQTTAPTMQGTPRKSLGTPTVEVIERRAAERSAALAHVGVVQPLLRLLERPPLATTGAANPSKSAITRAGVPGHDVVDRCSFRIGHVVGRSAQRLATIAKERVDFGHHSSPQQIPHLPLR